MRKWLYLPIYVIGYFIAILAIFLFIQKPIFIYYAVPDNTILSADSIFEIYKHGLTLDLAGSAYLTFIPLILMILQIWLPKLRPLTLMSFYNGVVAPILSVTTISDAVLYPFWGFKIDSTVLLYLNDLDKLSQNVSWLFMILAITCILILGFLTWGWLQVVCKLLVRHKESSFKWNVVQSLEFIVTGALLFICARGVQIWPKTPANAYFSEELFLNHSGVNPLFNFVYSLSHHGDKFSSFQFFDSEKIRCDISTWFPTESFDTNSIISSRRPDILLITIEGMGACFIGELGGLEGITPNMDSLINDSYTFTKCYASSFRTDRGLVSILSGLPAQPTTSAMRYSHVIRSLPGLPKSLVKYAGYSTTAMLGGDASFFNMGEYLAVSGHHEIIDIHDFPDSSKTTKWGAPDHLLFNRALKELNKNEGNNPRFTFLLTQSSHTPFDVPYNKFNDEKLNAFAYTDNAIGNFIRELEHTPVWKKLLIVITADHGFPFGDFEDPDHHHIPLIVTGGVVTRKFMDTRIVSQTDIAALILGQLGIPHSDFKYSRDIMSTDYVYPFSFSTFNNGFTFRDSSGVTVYDNVSKKPIHFPDSVRERKGKEILQSVYATLNVLNSKPQ